MKKRDKNTIFFFFLLGDPGNPRTVPTRTARKARGNRGKSWGQHVLATTYVPPGKSPYDARESNSSPCVRGKSSSPVAPPRCVVIKIQSWAQRYKGVDLEQWLYRLAGDSDSRQISSIVLYVQIRLEKVKRLSG